jgi:hypothetical protein
MSLFKINKENFYENLFEHKKTSSLLQILSNKYSNEKSNPINLYRKNTISNLDSIYTFELVPDYLNIKTNERLIEKKVFQKHGYGINLNNCKSANEYLQNHCRTNFRGNIRRSLKKIESCFNINYKMFFGNISHEDYTFLMSKFHEMLSKRFQQRNDKNLILENWEFYETNAFNLINKKEASLFVIYNEKEPIACSLNFHYKNIFYFAIPTFNIDYYKFAPGNIVIYKNIDWCIINNYSFFDMGYGGFENKLNWCNTTYLFENHILFKSLNALGYIYTIMLKYKYKLFNYLIDKNINGLVRNLTNFVKKRKPYKPLSYELITVNDDYDLKNMNLLDVIDFNTKKFEFLNKPIYDYLYKNCENIKNITVYKFNNEQNTFLISGKNHKLIIKALLNEINQKRTILLGF